MAINLKPLRWDWPDLTAGDTFPEIRVQESSSTTDCATVRVKIKPETSETASLTLLSSGAGVTIDDGTAGQWDFTINEIAASDTEDLAPGNYRYDIEVTDSAGTVRTEFSGFWRILTQVTDE